MSGDFTLDTNVIIDHLKGLEPAGRHLARLSGARLLASVITRFELMSFDGLSLDEELRIEEFLRHVTIIPFSDDVEQAAIRLRRREHLKLPDAAIAATALVTDSTLITNDHRLLRLKGSELKIIAPS